MTTSSKKLPCTSSFLFKEKNLSRKRSKTTCHFYVFFPYPAAASTKAKVSLSEQINHKRTSAGSHLPRHALAPPVPRCPVSPAVQLGGGTFQLPPKAPTSVSYSGPRVVSTTQDSVRSGATPPSLPFRLDSAHQHTDAL